MVVQSNQSITLTQSGTCNLPSPLLMWWQRDAQKLVMSASEFKFWTSLKSVKNILIKANFYHSLSGTILRQFFVQETIFHFLFQSCSSRGLSTLITGVLTTIQKKLMAKSCGTLTFTTQQRTQLKKPLLPIKKNYLRFPNSLRTNHRMLLLVNLPSQI